MRLGMSIANFGSDLRMEGRDLLHRIDLSSEYTGHNETIVGYLKTIPGRCRCSFVSAPPWRYGRAI